MIFELSLTPEWDVISEVRRFALAVLERRREDPDRASRVALATHELLENAVKYGVGGDVKLRLRADSDRVVRGVEVENSATQLQIDRLKLSIADLDKHARDPGRHYAQLMLKPVAPMTRSGLGLARIRTEAEMKVSCRVDGGRVLVSATL